MARQLFRLHVHSSVRPFSTFLFFFSVIVLVACGGAEDASTAATELTTEQSSNISRPLQLLGDSLDEGVVGPDDGDDWLLSALPEHLPAVVEVAAIPDDLRDVREAPQRLQLSNEDVTMQGAAFNTARVGWLTRFEAGETVQPGATAQRVAVNLSPNAWPAKTTAFTDDPGTLAIEYQGGNTSERLARVIAQPFGSRPNNHVLQFQLKTSNVRDASGLPYKGRVQMTAYETRASEMWFSTLMYLHPDMTSLRTLSRTFDWLTLAEWWNNAGWTERGYPFRVALNVVKPSSAPGSKLHFRAKAQTMDTGTRTWSQSVWQATNDSVEVPIGQWVTMEYYFREGNASNGRFYMAMVVKGRRQVLFDIRGWTHHPSDNFPDGLTHVNPLKLYAPKSIIDHVRDSGGSLQVYWDDLSFRSCAKHPRPAVSPCNPTPVY